MRSHAARIMKELLGDPVRSRAAYDARLLHHLHPRVKAPLLVCRARTIRAFPKEEASNCHAAEKGMEDGGCALLPESHGFEKRERPDPIRSGAR